MLYFCAHEEELQYQKYPNAASWHFTAPISQMARVHAVCCSCSPCSHPSFFRLLSSEPWHSLRAKMLHWHLKRQQWERLIKVPFLPGLRSSSSWEVVHPKDLYGSLLIHHIIGKSHISYVPFGSGRFHDKQGKLVVTIGTVQKANPRRVSSTNAI